MIEFRALDLNPTDGKLRTDLISGYFDPAAVRGQDWVIHRRDGQEIRAREKHSRIIELRTHVIGYGATEDERSEDWHTSMQALMAVLQFDDDPGTLEVGDGYLGFPSGTTASILARAKSIVYGPIENCMSYQMLSIELVANDPVEWTIES